MNHRLQLVLIHYYCLYIHTAVVCPALSNPANGVVSVIDLTFNSVATYTCNSGYVISGVQQRTCLETGEWSGQEPTCIRK